MISRESLKKKIYESGLKSSDLVKQSCGLIKQTQASQWINFKDNERGLGKAAIVMMWMMCENKMRDSKEIGFKDEGDRNDDDKSACIEVLNQEENTDEKLIKFLRENGYGFKIVIDVP